MGVDSVGVDEGELGEGLLPAGGGLAFDEVPVGFAFGAAAEAGFLAARIRCTTQTPAVNLLYSLLDDLDRGSGMPKCDGVLADVKAKP